MALIFFIIIINSNAQPIKSVFSGNHRVTYRQF